MSGNERRSRDRPATSTSWERVATWYDGWVGDKGSAYHQGLAIPAVLDLLKPARGERILDIGAGQGVLAPHIESRGALYTGIDAIPDTDGGADGQRRSRAFASLSPAHQQLRQRPGLGRVPGGRHARATRPPIYAAATPIAWVGPSGPGRRKRDTAFLGAARCSRGMSPLSALQAFVRLSFQITMLSCVDD